MGALRSLSGNESFVGVHALPLRREGAQPSWLFCQPTGHATGVQLLDRADGVVVHFPERLLRLHGTAGVELLVVHAVSGEHVVLRRLRLPFPGNATMDFQESKRIFGVPVGDTPAQAQAWWYANTIPGNGSGPLESSYRSWLYNLGNGKYDVYNGFQYYYSTDVTDLNGTVDPSTGQT